MADSGNESGNSAHKHRRKRTKFGWRTVLAVALPALILVAVGLDSGIGAGSDRPTPHPDLTVSSNGRYFVDPAGDPFFWLADTAWSMPVNLTREEVVHYLDVRAAQQFNVVQMAAIFNQAGGPGPNRYGDYPYGKDLSDLSLTDGADPNDAQQYDFWDHLDFIIDQANTRGIRVALVPIWASKQVGTVLTKKNAFDYGRFVGARYRDKQVIWVMGGDTSADGFQDVWRELARGIAVGTTGAEDYNTTLMTYHPIGGTDSLQWFRGDRWLDFDMVQGGHCLRYDERRAILDAAYTATPTRPFLDGEPIYAAHPYCWKPEDGYSTTLDVRRDAYWAVFAGAAGHTYGHHSVWQFLGSTGRPAELGAVGDWQSALEDAGAWQMRYLSDLMKSHPWWIGVPDESIITSEIHPGPSRLQAIRASDGSYAMVYSPDGRSFDADLSKLARPIARLSWFDPRTGEYSDVRTVSTGPATYTPPTAEDWVLVADAQTDSPSPSPRGTAPTAPCAETAAC